MAICVWSVDVCSSDLPATKAIGYICSYNRLLHKMGHEAGRRGAHRPKLCVSALAGVERVIISMASNTPRNVLILVIVSAANAPCFSSLNLIKRL